MQTPTSDGATTEVSDNTTISIIDGRTTTKTGIVGHKTAKKQENDTKPDNERRRRDLNRRMQLTKGTETEKRRLGHHNPEHGEHKQLVTRTKKLRTKAKKRGKDVRSKKTVWRVFRDTKNINQTRIQKGEGR